MARPKKYVTEEEQKAARTERARRWRKNKPHSYKRIQAAAYQRRKARKVAGVGATSTSIDVNLPKEAYVAKIDLSEVKETFLEDPALSEGDEERVKEHYAFVEKRTGRVNPLGKETGVKVKAFVAKVLREMNAVFDEAVGRGEDEATRRRDFEALKGRGDLALKVSPAQGVVVPELRV